MMIEHLYSNKNNAIRLHATAASLYDSVSQSATPSRMTHNSTTV